MIGQAGLRIVSVVNDEVRGGDLSRRGSRNDRRSRRGLCRCGLRRRRLCCRRLRRCGLFRCCQRLRCLRRFGLRCGAFGRQKIRVGSGFPGSAG